MAFVYLLLTYLFAAIPFGLVVTTLWGTDVDLRQAGSGNLGATNVARVFGWRLAVVVLALDVAKGFLPVLLAPAFGLPGVLGGSLVAVTAFVGHCFPITLEFRGGKGVATSAGAMLALAPIPTGLAAATWGALLAAFGRSSIASLIAAITLAISCALLRPAVLPVALVLAAGIVVTHTPNIRRLARGEEATIVRPVRWGRPKPETLTAEEALTQGPAGGATGGWDE